MKMKKNKILYIIIVFFLGINILLLFKFKKIELANKNIKFVADSLISEISTQNTSINNLLLNDSLQAIYNESLINPHVKLIDNNLDTVFLKDIIKKKTLILRYDELSCGACIDHIFEIIKSSNYENLIILTYYSKIRSLIVFQRKVKLKYPIYQVLNNDLIEQIDKYKTPYFFIINKHLRIDNIHLFLREFPQRTTNYLHNIKSRVKTSFVTGK
jgi:hypothetical protein